MRRRIISFSVRLAITASLALGLSSCDETIGDDTASVQLAVVLPSDGATVTQIYTVIRRGSEDGFLLSDGTYPTTDYVGSGKLFPMVEPVGTMVFIAIACLDAINNLVDADSTYVMLVNPGPNPVTLSCSGSNPYGESAQPSVIVDVHSYRPTFSQFSIEPDGSPPPAPDAIPCRSGITTDLLVNFVTEDYDPDSTEVVYLSGNGLSLGTTNPLSGVTTGHRLTYDPDDPNFSLSWVVEALVAHPTLEQGTLAVTTIGCDSATDLAAIGETQLYSVGFFYDYPSNGSLMAWYNDSAELVVSGYAYAGGSSYYDPSRTTSFGQIANLGTGVTVTNIRNFGAVFRVHYFADGDISADDYAEVQYYGP